MPVATPEQYAEMLDRAKAGGFAYPAFNVSSSQTVNAVLQGLTEAGSDGIIQVTTGGADYFAGHTVKARATGALAFAKFVHEVAKSYPITVALHTDHCPKPALEDFVLPLIAASEEVVADGGQPIFQSHMWDGSAVPLGENIEIAQELLPRLKAINAILEVEIGVVGGEEDGVRHEGSNDALYTTVADVTAAVEGLGLGEQGRWIAALTFGNVHGVYDLATSSCAPTCSARSRRASPRSSAPARSRSTWSSTAAAARPTPRSPRRSGTASSR